MGIELDEGFVWQRLGEIIGDQRKRLYRSQRLAAAATDSFVSEANWQLLEAGKARNPEDKTLRAVSEALRWPRPTLEQALAALRAGEEPEIPVDPRPPAPDLEERVASLEGEMEKVNIAIDRLASRVAALRDALRDDVRRQGPSR